MKNICFLLLFALALILPATASTININLDSQNRYLNPLRVSEDGVEKNVYAGVFQVTRDGLITRDALCVDYFTDISTGTLYQYNIYAPNDPAVLQYSTEMPRVAWLFGQQMPLINAMSTPYLKQVAGAALQLALWDIVVDGGDGLSAGRLREVTTTNNTYLDVYARASQLIPSSVNQSSNHLTVLMHVNGPNSAQTLISYESLAAPEPATMILTFSALGVLVGVGSRRRKRSTCTTRR